MSSDAPGAAAADAPSVCLPEAPAVTAGQKLCMLAIIAAALAIRLGAAPLIQLNSDEAHTFNVVRCGLADLLSGRAFDISHAQGYHLTLAALAKLFGDSILLARIINAILGSLAVLTVMVLVRKLAPVALIWLGVGLLMAVNPMMLMLSLQTRPYAMQSLALPLMLLAVLNWRERRKPGWLVLYALTVLVAFNYHYTSVFYIAGLGCWWLWVSRKDPREIGRIVAIHVVIMVLLIPSFLFMYKQIGLQASGRVTHGARRMYHVLGWPYYFVYGNSVARPEKSKLLLIATAAPLAILLLALVPPGLAHIWRNLKARRGLILTMLILPLGFVVLVNFLRPLASSRYASFMWPMFALVLMCGVWALKRSALRAAALGVLVVMGVMGSAMYVHRFASHYPPFASETLAAHARQPFAMFTYPSVARSMILEYPRDAFFGTLHYKKGQPLARCFPQPPIDFARGTRREWVPFDDAFLAKLPYAELWLYVDVRPLTAYLDGSRVLREVPAAVEKHYRLDRSFPWPNEDRPVIHMMKFRRPGAGPATQPAATP